MMPHAAYAATAYAEAAAADYRQSLDRIGTNDRLAARLQDLSARCAKIALMARLRLIHGISFNDALDMLGACDDESANHGDMGHLAAVAARRSRKSGIDAQWWFDLIDDTDTARSAGFYRAIAHRLLSDA